MWKLTVNPDNNSATLVCEDGNDNVVFAKPIEFTDFPKEGVTLWFANNVNLFCQANTDHQASQAVRLPFFLPDSNRKAKTTTGDPLSEPVSQRVHRP